MIFWIWGSFSCGKTDAPRQQHAAPWVPVSETRRTDLLVHGGHGLRHPLHGLSHAVVGLERLDLQADSLDVGFHQDELLDVAPGADQIFGHDLHSILGQKESFILEYSAHQTGKSRFYATICPCLAIFLMSAMIFFSCCSSFCLSLSSSLMARLRSLWFSLNICSGVFLLPKMNSIFLKIQKSNSQSKVTKEISHFVTLVFGQLIFNYQASKGILYVV